jgi:hypothetical protein
MTREVKLIAEQTERKKREKLTDQVHLASRGNSTSSSSSSLDCIGHGTTGNQMKRLYEQDLHE